MTMTMIASSRRAALYWPPVLLAMLMAGCSGRAVIADVSAESARRHADALIHEARAELDATRAELAASRIASARKEAEVQEVRQQADEYRHALETKDIELAALRRERDHLEQAKNEYVVQLDELPELRQRAAETAEREAALKKKLGEVESALGALKNDLKIQLAELPVLQQAVSQAKAYDQSVQIRMHELEAHMARVLQEWQQIKVDWEWQQTQAEWERIKNTLRREEPIVVRGDAVAASLVIFPIKGLQP
jgi:chromosome segregation ATPase